MNERRALVVRLGSLGDIVHTFPAAAALRESMAGGRIVWLTHPRWRELVESAAIANEVWAVETRDLKSLRETLERIRAANFGVSIDYQGLWKSAALPFLARVPRRIGFSPESVREFGVPVLYTDRVKASARHIVEQNGELSLRAGASDMTAPFELRVSDGDESSMQAKLATEGIAAGQSGYVVVSPGGGWRSKCWPPERFGELCRVLRAELHLATVINYGPGEESLAAAVRSHSGDSTPAAFCGNTGELMALLRGARCVVGGDTGPVHLAAALHAPVVALFGPTDPARNGPYHTRDVVLRSDDAATTYKRGKESDSAMLAISVAEVFEAVRRRLALVAA